MRTARRAGRCPAAAPARRATAATNASVGGSTGRTPYKRPERNQAGSDLVVALAGQVVGAEHEAPGLELRLEAVEVEERADQESGPDEEHARQRDLEDHERAAERDAGPAGRRSGLVSQRRQQRGSRAAEGGHEAGEEAAQETRRRRDSEDAGLEDGRRRAHRQRHLGGHGGDERVGAPRREEGPSEAPATERTRLSTRSWRST